MFGRDRTPRTSIIDGLLEQITQAAKHATQSRTPPNLARLVTGLGHYISESAAGTPLLFARLLERTERIGPSALEGCDPGTLPSLPNDKRTAQALTHAYALIALSNQACRDAVSSRDERAIYCAIRGGTEPGTGSVAQKIAADARKLARAALMPEGGEKAALLGSLESPVGQRYFEPTALARLSKGASIVIETGGKNAGRPGLVARGGKGQSRMPR